METAGGSRDRFLQSGDGRTKEREDSQKWWEYRERWRVQTKRERELPLTPLFILRKPPRRSTRSGLYARFRGQNLRNVRGWNPSIRFFNCKKDLPRLESSGSPLRKPAPWTLSPPTGLDSFERTGDKSFEAARAIVIRRHRMLVENFSRTQIFYTLLWL